MRQSAVRRLLPEAGDHCRLEFGKIPPARGQLIGAEPAADASDRKEQARILNGLQGTIRLDQVRFKSGLGSRLDVLGAEERLLTAREQAVDLEADGQLARIRLVTALGGGFAASAGDPRTSNKGS